MPMAFPGGRVPERGDDVSTLYGTKSPNHVLQTHSPSVCRPHTIPLS